MTYSMVLVGVWYGNGNTLGQFGSEDGRDCPQVVVTGLPGYAEIL